MISIPCNAQRKNLQPQIICSFNELTTKEPDWDILTKSSLNPIISCLHISAQWISIIYLRRCQPSSLSLHSDCLVSRMLSVLKARSDLIWPDKSVTDIILVIFPATLQLADNLYLSPLSLKLMLCFRLARRLRVIVVAGVGVGVVGAAYITLGLNI